MDNLVEPEDINLFLEEYSKRIEVEAYPEELKAFKTGRNIALSNIQYALSTGYKKETVERWAETMGDTQIFHPYAGVFTAPTIVVIG